MSNTTKALIDFLCKSAILKARMTEISAGFRQKTHKFK